jgi:hypothetical protein
VRPDEFEKLARSPEPAWVAYWRVALSLPGALALLSDLLSDLLADVLLDLRSVFPLVLPLVLLSADALSAAASNSNRNRKRNKNIPIRPDARSAVAIRGVDSAFVALRTVAGDTAVERLIASAVKR